MSDTELSVVCPSCASEVSPYVTECPYCGNRLRKRAPKLQRSEDDELTAIETRADQRRRKRRERAATKAERAADKAEHGTRSRFETIAVRTRTSSRPLATIALVLAPAVMLVVIEAAGLSIFDVGAIVGPVDGEWWRYLAAPFANTSVGYLFAIALGIAIFGSALEPRIGTATTLLLALACGALGMLAADAAETTIGGGGVLVAAGGNGMALGLLSAWAVILGGPARAGDQDQVEPLIALVAAAVLLLLPVFVGPANVYAGLGGALAGAACGAIALLAGRERRSRRPKQ